jgi:hypothetical protein
VDEGGTTKIAGVADRDAGAGPLRQLDAVAAGVAQMALS